MSIDERLLDIIVCPVDKDALLYFPDEAAFYNPRLHRLYLIEAGIPLMRADQSRPVDAERHRALLDRAAAGAARATLGVPVRDLVRAAEEFGAPAVPYHANRS